MFMSQIVLCFLHSTSVLSFYIRVLLTLSIGIMILISPYPSGLLHKLSMVDSQWNILYWGSKWNLHTACWGAVGCEWRATSVYFGITYVCFIPSRPPVFAVESQYQHGYFLCFVKSIIGRTHTKSFKKSCRFKTWVGFIGPMLSWELL